jgi:hypothetical protein
MQLESLVGALNAMLTLSHEPSRVDLLRVFDAACKELTYLQLNDIFWSQMDQTVANRAVFGREVAETFEDLGRFQKFLRLEEDALVEAGVDGGATDVIVSEMQAVRQAAGNSRPDLEAVRRGIGELAIHVCKSAGDLKRLSDEDGRLSTFKAPLRRAIWGVSGATVVAINLSVQLPTAALSSVSVSLGVNLMMKAFN